MFPPKFQLIEPNDTQNFLTWWFYLKIINIRSKLKLKTKPKLFIE